MRIVLFAASALLVRSGCDLFQSDDVGDFEATVAVAGADADASTSVQGGEATAGADGALTFSSREGSEVRVILRPVGSLDLGVGTFDVVPFPAHSATPGAVGYDGLVVLSSDEPLSGIWNTREGTITVTSASADEVSGTVRVVAVDPDESDEEVTVDATFRAVW